MGNLDNSTLFLMAVVAVGVAIGIGYFFFRWVFDVEKNNEYQEKQIKLLMKIAEQQGVHTDTIKEIVGAL